MTQFPDADAVDIDGKTYTRADFEKQTPQILVESPLPFEEVKTPLRVTGTANTFEATFDYELRDSAGKVVDSNFVTATSGTGTRGTFDFTTKAVDDVASLVVFELPRRTARASTRSRSRCRRASRSDGLSSRRAGCPLAVLGVWDGQRAGGERVSHLRSLAEPVRHRGQHARGHPSDQPASIGTGTRIRHGAGARTGLGAG